jgi:hypothetical protein
MALPTLYKARGVPVKQPVCAICADRTRGRTVSLRLTHGITIWLCAAHASPEFQHRRNGHDFVVTLQRLWQAHGCLTAARGRALAAHLDALAGPPPARRPGSYAWPDLRRRAEAEFALGGPPLATIMRLRRICADGPAAPPSVRTMLRWHREGRWLTAPLPAADGRDDVDPGVGCKRGPELRPFPIDVHVDVPAQRRARLAQAVADSGPALVEPVDGLVHRGRLDIEPAGQVGEHRGQRDWEVEISHGYPTTATSTEAMPGR